MDFRHQRGGGPSVGPKVRSDIDTETMKPNRSTEDDRYDAEAVTPYYVLGDGHLGAAVARRLREDGRTATTVDTSGGLPKTPGQTGNLADVRLLEDAGVADASTVLVTTSSDSRNLLLAQLVRAHFDVSRVLVLVNSPPRQNIFADAGHEPVCATTALSDALVENV